MTSQGHRQGASKGASIAQVCAASDTGTRIPRLSTLGRLTLAATLLTGLAACQSGGLAFNGGSPAGKPVAVESIEGVPPAIGSALASEMQTEAAARQVEMVGMGQPARYRLRGYLTTETGESGESRLAYVFDVFDAEKRRARRVTGSAPAQLAGADPLASLDRQALRRLAQKSVEELAAFLSTEPAADVAGDAAASSEEART